MVAIASRRGRGAYYQQADEEVESIEEGKGSSGTTSRRGRRITHKYIAKEVGKGSGRKVFHRESIATRQGVHCNKIKKAIGRCTLRKVVSIESDDDDNLILRPCSEIEKQIEKERSEVIQGVQNILQNIKSSDSNDNVLLQLKDQVDILKKEQSRLAQDSDVHREKNLKLLKQYSRLESENFILEQKIKREKEKRREMDSQKLKDEFELEMNSEREFNQNIKSRASSISQNESEEMERSRRSHSLPPSSQPPQIVSQLPLATMGGLPTGGMRSTTPRGGSSGNMGETYPFGASPRKQQSSPYSASKVIGLPIPGSSGSLLGDGISSSLPNQSHLVNSSFAERMSQLSCSPGADPYARTGLSPRLGSTLQFVKQSPRKKL